MAQTGGLSDANRAAAQRKLDLLPLRFEPNRGQSSSDAGFLARGRGFSALFKPSEADLLFAGPAEKRSLLRVRLLNAAAGTGVSGEERLPGTVNYFIGNDPGQWHTGLPTFRRLRYSGVYPGTDLVFYGNKERLEFDFQLSPGAAPNKIQMRFDGARSLTIDGNGDLVVTADGGQIVFRKPVIYQPAEDGRRDPVAGSFRVLKKNTVRFAVSRYNGARPLIVDPILNYSTYIGSLAYASGIAVDQNGDAYVTGVADLNFPTTSGSYQPVAIASTTADDMWPSVGKPFVAKFNSTGTELLYSTFLSGSGIDVANRIALDANGDAYVVGTTSSTNFPVTAGALQTVNSASQYTGFVAELNNSGSSLLYSTYLGGSTSSSVLGVAVDGSGNAYLAGNTFDANFPTTPGAYEPAPPAKSASGYSSAFIAKLNPAGAALVYSTYLGGSQTDGAVTIAVDSTGEACVGGNTTSNNFPVTPGAIQSSREASNKQAGFVTKLNASGSGLVYSTYLGGNWTDGLTAITLDSNGNAYATGTTNSEDFPTTYGAFRRNIGVDYFGNPQQNAFVTELNPSGTSLVYSTFLGGSISGTEYANVGDEAYGIALDGQGMVYVAGIACTIDYPLTQGTFQPENSDAANSAGCTGFLTKLDPSPNTLLTYSTFFGGTGNQDGDDYPVEDGVAGLALDSSANVYVAGTTHSVDFPTTAGVVETAFPGVTQEVTVAEFNGSEMHTLPIPTVTVTSNTASVVYGQPVTFTATVQSVTGGAMPTGFAGFNFLEPETSDNPDPGNTTGIGFGPWTTVPLNSGVASFTTSSLVALQTPVNAFYLGDENYAPATGTMTQTVTDFPTVTTITPSSNNVPYGTTITFTIIVVDQNGNPAQGFVLSGNGNSGGWVYLNSSGVGTWSESGLPVGTTSVYAKFFGYTGYQDSSATVNITVTPLGVTPPPAISPPSGSYSSIQQVTLSDSNSAAVVYYTLDGSTPVPGTSAEYLPGFGITIAVNSSETINAIAAAPGYSASNMVSATYVLNLPAAAAPEFTPAAGTYTSAQQVTISDTTPGATIYYTTNGSAPTTSSAFYNGPITVPASETIEAIAVASGYANSAVAGATYTINLPIAATPTFSQAAGTYASAPTVIISDLTPGATIYYTTNGTVPTTSSSVYSTPIVVSTSETLRAIAALTGYTSSGVAVAAYTITASPGSAGDWTWMSGSSQNRQPAGVYGQLGAPASGNTPGGREGTISWTDANGNRWLFGSQEAGFDGNGVYAYLDDVWEYNASTQQWAWMAGSNSVPAGSSNGCYVCTAPPVFGSYQTPAAGNTPGSLQSPVQWTDKAGNLWLFGGYEYQIDLGTVTAEAMNALWEFNVSSHQWAWIGGSDSVNGNAPGVYGSQGQPAPGNTPGGRTGAVTWTDSGGNLWLFGGNGQDSAGITGYLNDLWMFNPTTAQWTWMGGSSTFSAACLAGTGACTAPSVPGTLQTPAAGNMPMGRSGATLWTDLRGNTWLFGGQTEVFYNIGISSGTEGTFINDMWELDANTHEWTWISGNASLTGNAPEFGNSPGVYGSQGMFSAANTPGGRVSRYMQTSETWTDTSGDLWLFGGNGFDSASKVGQLNDLWKFNTSLLKWAWMGGSSTLEPGCINGSTTCSPPGNYGTLGVPASTNGPGARGGAVQWTDQSGNFWIFGGWGTDSVGTWGYLNDLWELNPATALWTWQGGSNKVPNDGSNSQGQLGVYGSLGVPATTNQPGGRTAAAGWFDGSGHLWIFGGYGCDSNYCEGWLNDLWELGQQFSVSAPIIAPAPGTYTSPQSVAITDSTPGATIYYTTNGTTPTASSTVYIGPITVSSSETIEAVAVAGDTNSPIASAAYTITLPVAATPTISLAAGTYTSSQTVSLSDTTPGATIYYAINAAPTTSSTVYSGPISVSASETIETIATASGYTTSAAASANYTISSSGSGPGGWTWMGGSDIEDQPGIYGTLGVPAAGNVPDARSVAASWTDQSGNFWLFGGNVFDANDNTCHLTAGSCVLNDLWKYTPLTGEWAWMNGTLASTPITGGDWGPPGVYGTPGVPFAGNVPGARYTAYSWTDSSGNLWLFGGFGMDAAGNFGDLNDLWKYTPSTGEWTWMSGSSEINQPGVYGTLGVPAAGNVPGARSWGLSWTDPSGNLWLFGAGINDLWKYTPSTGEWTWMSGSDSSASSFPVYGTLGVPAAGNVPGGRYDAVSWTDSSGNLWLFGGIGEYAPVTGYSLSDLWEYTPSTGEWAWMGGSNSADQPAVYGVLGVPAPANQPGARASATAWTDMHGNLWLFGGCPPSGGSGGCLNDLWEYVPSSGMWTWMGGANTKDQSGFYGTLGLPATGNVPGARANPASWTDLSGNLWLFGGSGWDANGNVGDLNDLWRYGIASATNPVAATPTVSPAAGTYTSSQSVTLSDFTPGATIYYTTNGTAPTASSTVYSGAIAVSASETIEAIAVAGGFTNSSVASATYTITLPVAATPAISLAGGTYTGSQTVSLSDTTPGAIIYYTTNGTAPTASSTVYSGAITVSNSETIEAIAVAGGFTNSSVASATYTILTPAAAPVFGPTAGTYSSPQSVTLTDSTPGTTIYYAINATPTTSSTPYTGPITVPGSASETIEAIAAGPDNSSSAVSSATYTILLPAEAPSFNPPAGAYSSPQSVTLTNNAPGTTVYYAINAVPTASSTPYTGTISVSSSETIEAVDVSTAGASTVSALSSAAYTINLAAPTFTLSVSPAGLTMNAGGSSVSTVTVTPSSGFNAQVTLACTGLPAGVTCSFSPATVTPSGSAVTSQLTIAAGAQAMQRRQDRPWVPGSALALAAGLLVWKRWKSVRLCVVVLAAVFGLGLLSGCGQLLVSSVSPPPKTFTVTVSGTSGATTQTASLMLTVN